jgi:hypothetical protein
MDKLWTIVVIAIFLQACGIRKKARYIVSYMHHETVNRDSLGRVTGEPVWDPPFRMIDQSKRPADDTLVIYGDNDSIRIFTPTVFKQVFTKVHITSATWKPKPAYGNQLHFIGTFEDNVNAPGVYCSFYGDGKGDNIMFIIYTNPGNMMDAMLASKDSVNILKKERIILDPRGEPSTPDSIKVGTH